MTVAWCARCRRPAPVEADELLADGGGDPDLAVVLVPPVGWLPDPDDADGGLVCGGCATRDEAVAHVRALATVEWILGTEGDE